MGTARTIGYVWEDVDFLRPLASALKGAIVQGCYPFDGYDARVRIDTGGATIHADACGFDAALTAIEAVWRAAALPGNPVRYLGYPTRVGAGPACAGVEGTVGQLTAC